MFERIILDVDKALDAEAYLSALALMMTIPDICAKAEYGDKIGKKARYIKWFDEYIGQYNRAPIKEGDMVMPYLSGEFVYQLRCSILHEGHPDIDKTKIDAEENKIDFFTLVVEKKNEFDIYFDSSSVTSDIFGTVRNRAYKVNIRRLWIQIKSVAGYYYDNNKEKFNFLNYKIVDKGNK